MARTSIEWTAGEDGEDGMSWNVLRGCARISPGCENCYAERQAARFCAPGEPYNELISVRSRASDLRYTNPHAAGHWTQPRWTGATRYVPTMLEAPLRWKRARHVFANSMSDLYHDDVSNEQIAAVFGIMAAATQHTFYVLTKRPQRTRSWFEWIEQQMDGDDAPRRVLHDAIGRVYNHVYPGVQDCDAQTPLDVASEACCDLDVWPLPNVLVGVSVEDQRRANERIPLLRRIPAAVRWLSVEPLLERVQLELDGIDWVVVGGESGPRARQCNRRWIEDVVQQCQRASVPVFVKQLGAAYCDTENAVGGSQTPRMSELGPISRLKDRKGADMDEWPPSLRIRDRPATNQRFAATNTEALESHDVNLGGE